MHIHKEDQPQELSTWSSLKYHNQCLKKNERAGVFLHLSKAFNSVDHKILLEKLERMGYRGIEHTLLKSYPTNRMQCVQVNSNAERCQSHWLQNEKDILQGSILGAFLFTLYMNDLPEVTQHFISLYADDTSIIVKIKNKDTLKEEATDVLTNWFSVNDIKLNIRKTNIIEFTFKKNNDYCLKINI
ncbi:hypothetical protein Trydic_g3983 [Trypoxylus dichotomus]